MLRTQERRVPFWDAQREMAWIDSDTYFGPSRRRKNVGMRLRERRRYDCAGAPPSLNAALRHLRLRTIDARGPAGAGDFAERTHSVALLANMNGEHEASMLLERLSSRVSSDRQRDLRPEIYDALDRVQGAITYH